MDSPQSGIELSSSGLAHRRVAGLRLWSHIWASRCASPEATARVLEFCSHNPTKNRSNLHVICPAFDLACKSNTGPRLWRGFLWISPVHLFFISLYFWPLHIAVCLRKRPRRLRIALCLSRPQYDTMDDFGQTAKVSTISKYIKYQMDVSRMSVLHKHSYVTWRV